MYGFFDLLGDVDGLIDLFIFLFVSIMNPYNETLSKYQSFVNLYKINAPLNSFFDFWLLRNLSCNKTSQSKQLIEACDRAMDKELDIHELLIKMRQF